MKPPVPQPTRIPTLGDGRLGACIPEFPVARYALQEHDHRCITLRCELPARVHFMVPLIESAHRYHPRRLNPSACIDLCVRVS